MTLLKDLIEIPEQVHAGDFVLRLAEGVENKRQTLRDYVVTPDLVRCFDDALALIGSALQGRSSKAAYLHGSFGSGKSHFMAVLHLLLEHDPDARAIPELAAVVEKHSTWLDGKQLLLPTYHLIGATSLESALFGGYAEHVRRVRPDAPVPPVYVADSIFENAMELRRGFGDERFFEQLNDGGGGGGDREWGELGGEWTAETFEQALEAAPGSELRGRLVSTLVDRLLPAFRAVASADSEAFVPIDEGLSAISRHASSLGYDGVVLFLDELILWLASRIADFAFVAREAPKVAKLVEAATADRPAPLISFVARQRDLRDLVGKDVPGAEHMSFSDTLQWWEGRFEVITLEDRNLPAIAEKRLLRPKEAAERQKIDQAFSETDRVRREVMEALLTSDGDRALFRQTYPFSPAFTKTLIAASAALQRERTALKVMLQLLVNERDDLELGDIVPVGELYDVLAEGDQPFTEELRRHFELAKKLYANKLRPVLLEAHVLSEEDVEQLPRRHAFRADDRLMKTLLLSALVPDVEPLRALDAGRLAALNHGQITSPIPGQERQLVIQKVRQWAAQVGEIKVSDDAVNPTITLELVAVDVESILARARHFDTAGSRRTLIRDLVLGDFGVTESGELTLRHEFVWRGSKREIELVFGNIRDAHEIPDATLRSHGDTWKLIIDFPFDEEGYSPADDRARIESCEGHALTVCWLPNFLTHEAQAQLGTLVILESLLTGERLDQYADHLSAVDREAARPLLENRRSMLREQVRAAIAGAYAATTPDPRTVDAALAPSDQFLSLDRSFQPVPPPGPTLGAALENLRDQMLSHQYPEHPHFPELVKPADLRKVHDEVRRAISAPNRRIEVDKPLRPVMRQIAQPLKLGEMYEMPFVLGEHWVEHFHRLRAAARERGEGDQLTVSRLRNWIDEPRPMGLLPPVQNLVILTFADQSNRSFFAGEEPFPASLENLQDDVELCDVELPPEEEWKAAITLADKIFGITASPLVNANNVASLVREVRERTSEKWRECSDLVNHLADRLPRLGIDGDPEPDRLRTARAAVTLIENLGAKSETEVVGALAAAQAPTTPEALGRSIAEAGVVAVALDSARWDVLEPVFGLADDGNDAAARIRDQVIDAMRHDELVVPLPATLRAAESAAARLLAGLAPLPGPKKPTPTPGMAVLATDERRDLDAAGTTELFDELRGTLEGDAELRADVAWTLKRLTKPE